MSPAVCLENAKRAERGLHIDDLFARMQRLNTYEAKTNTMTKIGWYPRNEPHWILNEFASAPLSSNRIISSQNRLAKRVRMGHVENASPVSLATKDLTCRA